MCILKAFSQSTSFKRFADSTPNARIFLFHKGDFCNPESEETYDDFRISFDVSNKEWDDFPGQTEDVIAFLSKWEPDLHQFISAYEPTEMILDFPLYSRLNDNIINQNDYLPKELIALAGRLGLCIGMSIYQEDRIVEL